MPLFGSVLESLRRWAASSRPALEAKPRERRGCGFNPQEVANLRSWGYEPRPDEVIPVFVAPRVEPTSRYDALRSIAERASRPRSQEEAEADQRRRQADIERQMGLRPR